MLNLDFIMMLPKSTIHSNSSPHIINVCILAIFLFKNGEVILDIQLWTKKWKSCKKIILNIFHDTPKQCQLQCISKSMKIIKDSNE